MEAFNFKTITSLPTVIWHRASKLSYPSPTKSYARVSEALQVQNKDYTKARNRALYFMKAHVGTEVFYKVFPKVLPAAMHPLLRTSLIVAVMYPGVQACTNLACKLNSLRKGDVSFSETIRNLIPDTEKDYREDIKQAVIQGLKYALVGPFIAYLSAVFVPLSIHGILLYALASGFMRSMTGHLLFAKKATINTTSWGLPNFALQGFIKGIYNCTIKMLTNGLLHPKYQFLVFAISRQLFEPFINALNVYKVFYLLGMEDQAKQKTK